MSRRGFQVLRLIFSDSWLLSLLFKGDPDMANRVEVFVCRRWEDCRHFCGCCGPTANPLADPVEARRTKASASSTVCESMVVVFVVVPLFLSFLLLLWVLFTRTRVSLTFSSAFPHGEFFLVSLLRFSD